jgi:hypothetical protein
MSGRMRGIRGADEKCYKQAKQVGKKGTYRAFLSTKTQDLASLVYHDIDKSVPIVNMKVNINSFDLCVLPFDLCVLPF